MVMYSSCKPKPHGVARETVLSGKRETDIYQAWLDFIQLPNSAWFSWHLLQRCLYFTPEWRELYLRSFDLPGHTQLASQCGRISETWAFLLAPWTLWRKFALFWSIPSEVNHRHPYVNSSSNPSWPQSEPPLPEIVDSHPLLQAPPMGLWFPVNYCLPRATLMAAQCWPLWVLFLPWATLQDHLHTLPSKSYIIKQLDERLKMRPHHCHFSKGSQACSGNQGWDPHLRTLHPSVHICFTEWDILQQGGNAEFQPFCLFLSVLSLGLPSDWYG